MVLIFLLSLFNGILSFVGYLMLKPTLWKKIIDIIQPVARVYTFPKCISSKVNDRVTGVLIVLQISHNVKGKALTVCEYICICLVWFIFLWHNIVGFLMPNPLLYIKIVLFQTIQLKAASSPLSIWPITLAVFSLCSLDFDWKIVSLIFI